MKSRTRIPISPNQPTKNAARLCYRSVLTAALMLGLPTAHAALTHEYSFNDNPSSTNCIDSVGGATGNLYPGASFPGNGTLALDGTTGFVWLPDDLVSNYTSVTFEVWATPTSNPTWARLFDFGINQGGPGTGGAGGTGGNGINWMYMCLNDGNGTYRGDINPGGNVAGPQPAAGQLHHLVWTIDNVAQTTAIYDNGQMVGFLSNFAATPQAVGHTYNDYIGRSQWPDAYFPGSLDEFRIYNSALTPVQVEADYEKGAGVVNAAAGTLSALQFNNAVGMVVGGKFTPSVLGNYSSLSNLVNITTMGGITYSSDNTNVLSYNSDGNFHANNTGTTTVHATYSGKTANLTVTVSTEPAVLLHRYSFNGTAGSTQITDSIGGANGTLMNGSATATLTGNGKLALDGNGSSGYVSLPSGLMAQLTNATFEIWVTNLDNFTDWAELYAFGTNNGTRGFTYITLIPNNPASSKIRLDYAAGTDQFVDAPISLPYNTLT
ncbi:MAG TPA: LamG domain-containing protein, partial [Verrucomicrobiae bacterium]